MPNLNSYTVNNVNQEVYAQISESIYLLDTAKQASEDATANHSIQTAIEKLIQLRNRIGSGDLGNFQSL
ncbi:MAG: hypothetical protein WBA93_26150 [Microcoleaceae cyanobacterium]